MSTQDKSEIKDSKAAAPEESKEAAPAQSAADVKAVIPPGEAEFDYPAIPHKPTCDNPKQYIWSEEKAMFPESFVDSTQKYDKDAPPPKYLTDEELLAHKHTKKEDILNGFRKGKDGTLVCTDAEAIQKQSGILGEVLRQLTINLMQGLTITHISMPVRIFEPRTSLERIVDLFSFAPIYLKRAAQTEDKLERLKLVMTYAMSSIYLICGQNKPFNPLLGETMQVQFDDETKVYGEHTSHHPPISNYLIEGPGFKVYGYVEFIGSMGANYLRAGQKGPHNVVFDDGHHIRYSLMDYKLGGTIRGPRTVEPCGNFVFEDLTENLRAIIIANTFKREGYWTVVESGAKDGLDGILYKPTEEIDRDVSMKKYFRKNPVEIKSLDEIKDVEEEIFKIKGGILSSFSFGDEEVWNINEAVPVRHYPVIGEYVCPSDWRFREDLIWLKRQCLDYAGAWKLRKEQQQRKDRASRQEVTKRRNKGL